MANPFDPLNKLQGTAFGQGYDALYGAWNNGSGYQMGNQPQGIGTNQYNMGNASGQINSYAYQQPQQNYSNYLLPYLSGYNQQSAQATDSNPAPAYDATKANQDIFGLSKNGMNVRYEMANNQFYVTDPATGFKFNVVDGKANNVQGVVDPSKAWTAQYSTPTSQGDGGFSGGPTENQIPQITGYTLNAPYQNLQDLLKQLGSDYVFKAPDLPRTYNNSGQGGGGKNDRSGRSVSNGNGSAGSHSNSGGMAPSGGGARGGVPT